MWFKEGRSPETVDSQGRRLYERGTEKRSDREVQSLPGKVMGDSVDETLKQMKEKRRRVKGREGEGTCNGPCPHAGHHSTVNNQSRFPSYVLVFSSLNGF